MAQDPIDPQGPGKKRLRKSASQKMLFGVAGGLAEYLSVDPTVVRIGFVLLAFLSGTGILLYIILALLMPPDDSM